MRFAPTSAVVRLDPLQRRAMSSALEWVDFVAVESEQASTGCVATKKVCSLSLWRADCSCKYVMKFGSEMD